MCRQSKQESNSTNQLAITMNTVQHNKIHNYHKIVAFPWQKSRLRGLSLEAGSLLLEQGDAKLVFVLQCLAPVKIILHIKTEKKKLTKT